MTNLYGGYLAATYSPKFVLSAGVVVWSLFTALTPLSAAAMWLPALLLVRACMGLGEGVAFPTLQVGGGSERERERERERKAVMAAGHGL